LKKLQLITPFPMQWVEGYKKVFKADYDVEVLDKPSITQADVRLFMWCNQDTVDFINSNDKDSKNIVFIRRYEFYAGYWDKLDKKKVDTFVFVNDYFAWKFHKYTGVEPKVIYNGVQLDNWTYQKRAHGKRIAIVGYVNPKKNLPLALQILDMLPAEYELHIAGGVQDPMVRDYIDNLARAMQRKVFFYGHIPASEMDTWLDDKDYLLSVAMSEGCPNNVIEAMAKGIKPIIHNWPGADRQFGPFVFNSVLEAAQMLDPESPYNSECYKLLVADRFADSTYLDVKALVGGL